MQIVMGMMERPEQAIASTPQQTNGGSQGKKAVGSGRTTEESKFREFLDGLAERKKEEKTDRPVATDDLWAQLILLFPQLSTTSGSVEGAVHVGTGEELGATGAINGEILARVTELTAENTNTAGDDVVAIETSTLEAGAETMSDLEQILTAMPTVNDPLALVASNPESEDALSVATLKSTGVEESDESQELRLADQALSVEAGTGFAVGGTGAQSHQSGLTGDEGSDFQDLAGFGVDRQLDAKVTQASHQSAGDQDSMVAADTTRAEAENEFQVKTEHSGESKIVKTEFEPFLNSVAEASSPVPQEAEASPGLTETTSPLVTKEAFASQIISGAKLMLRNGVTKIQIQLEPAELGKLELSLVIERDLVAARFVTETQGVQSLIESNLTQLRSSLEEAGLSVDLLQVGVQAGTDQQQNQTASGDEQHKRNAGRVTSFNGMYGVEEQVFADEAWHGMVNFRA